MLIMSSLSDSLYAVKLRFFVFVVNKLTIEPHSRLSASLKKTKFHSFFLCYFWCLGLLRIKQQTIITVLHYHIPCLCLWSECSCFTYCALMVGAACVTSLEITVSYPSQYIFFGDKIMLCLLRQVPQTIHCFEYIYKADPLFLPDVCIKIFSIYM